jgi:hypothetical protein
MIKKTMTSMLVLLAMSIGLNAQTNGTWYKFTDAVKNYQNMRIITDKKGKMYLSAGLGSLEIGGKQYGGVAVWNDTTWANVGNLKPSSSISDMAFDSKGNLYACGSFSFLDAAGLDVSMSVGKWNGKAWSVIAADAYSPASLSIDSKDNVYVGGAFTDVDNTPNTAYLAKWDGTKWSSVGGELDAKVAQIKIDKKDNLYIRGDFKKSGTIVLNELAVLKNNVWASLDGGNSAGTNYAFSTMALDNNDQLWVGGAFGKVGTLSQKYLAVWNGTAWKSPVATPVGTVKSLTVDAKNDLYAAVSVGGFPVLYSLNTTALKAIPNSPDDIREIYYDKLKKRVYVSGSFSTPSNNLTYYTPSTVGTKEENLATFKMTLSPNPTTQQLFVDFQEGIETL